MEHKNVGNHAVDLASGLVLAPGETSDISEADVRDPHNASLIADGVLLAIGEDGPETNATDEAIALAGESGVDLTDIPGSGSGGRITKPDVERYLASFENGEEG